MKAVNQKFIKRLTGLVCFLSMILGMLCYSIPAKAATSCELVYSGSYNYDSAYECLAMVNEQRKAQGLQPLKMDQGLLDAAMQRAAETSIYWSHTRPDGSRCFSINSNMYGENIAANYSTNAEYVMNQWMNSSGHKGNILNSNFTSMGIGCFTQGGVVFWVQCFGRTQPASFAKPSNKTIQRSTKVADTLLDADMFQFRQASYDMTAGDTKTLEARIINQGWSVVVCELEPSSFNWSSSNSSVVSVDANGNATGRRAGTAVVTAKLKSAPYTEIKKTIKVTGPATVYNGVDYSPVYDYYYYINKHSDVKNAFGGNANKTLAHFVNYGMKEGRQACENFNVTSYKNRYADLRKAFGNDMKKYYIHYMYYGQKEGRVATGTVTTPANPSTTTQKNITVYNGKDYSTVYNYEYYIAKYPDIKKAFNGDRTATLSHFVNYGMKEGRQACANFNVLSYAYKYADLRNAYKNDLKKYYMHYIDYGKKEGRTAIGTSSIQNCVTVYNGKDYREVYNGTYYASKYSDIRKAYGLDDAAMLRHFVNYGMKEARQGIATFNVINYKNRYVDLKNAYGNNLKSYYMHYINYGKKEGRSGK